VSAKTPLADLRGARLTLRELRAEHLAAVVEWRNQPANRVCFFHQQPLRLDQQQEWFARYLADPTDRTFIILLEHHLPAGMLGLYHQDLARRRAEFGRLLLADAYRGHGYAEEACRLCLDYARQLGLGEVYLEVWADNLRAIRLYQRLGFAATGQSVRDGRAVIAMGLAL
jgi:RimJ/RimL family protein N-acetyltransferase